MWSVAFGGSELQGQGLTKETALSGGAAAANIGGSTALVPLVPGTSWCQANTLVG